MRLFFELVLSAAIAVGSSQLLSAQDLAPRAYVITPLHANAITLTWAFYDGNINYNGALPVSGATGATACQFSVTTTRSAFLVDRPTSLPHCLTEQETSGEQHSARSSIFTAPVFWIRYFASR